MPHICGLEIQFCLSALGCHPDSYILWDDWYDFPSDYWLDEVFPEMARAHLKSLGLPRPGNPESGDCDDTAREVAMYAQRCHRNTQNGNPAALAYGVFGYLPAGQSSGHVINVAFVCDGIRSGDGRAILRPRFQDFWQMNHAITLSAQEILSCSCWFV